MRDGCSLATQRLTSVVLVKRFSEKRGPLFFSGVVLFSAVRSRTRPMMRRVRQGTKRAEDVLRRVITKPAAGRRREQVVVRAMLTVYNRLLTVIYLHVIPCPT